MPPETLHSQAGNLALSRIPPNLLLKAWNAADEYLLDHLAGADLGAGHTVLVNDAFGALTCGLISRRPTSWSDSYVSHQATDANLAANHLPNSWQVAPSTQPPDTQGDQLALLVVKVPKTLALLEYQLRTLRPMLTANTLIVGAGMTRHIHRSTLEIFERIIGPTSTSLARKKARLIWAIFAPDLLPGPPAAPTVYDIGNGLNAVTLPGVFSQHHLDLGTRSFLDHLPAPPAGSNVLDLGCGNGAVGVSLAARSPSSVITFTDSSYLAVESARATTSRCFPERSRDVFVVDDAGQSLSSDSFDFVAVNPPFHEQHAVGTTQASIMFESAKRLLRRGGDLWVVANRHLRYDQLLRQSFSRVSVEASNPKFVVLLANRGDSN
jgi:23S rRNA (guanine1835-N2)-methyltransferase